MLHKSFILTLSLCLVFFATSLSAKSEMTLPVSADTTTVIGVTDSLAAALQGAFVDTTAVEKVRDRGFDASRYKMLKRYTPKDHHVFKNEYFSDNTFYSVRAATQKLGAVDYPFGLVAGFSFGKWLHEDHALRLNLSFGHWYDNFNGYDTYHYTFDELSKSLIRDNFEQPACVNCPSNPKNGGSGICFCTLGQQAIY